MQPSSAENIEWEGPNLVTKSAIEVELLGFLQNFKHRIQKHDTGVLFGVAMSCVPIPFISLIGLFVGLMNRHLVRSRKLDIFENGLISTGIIISLAVTTASFAAGIFIFSYLSHIDHESAVAILQDLLIRIGRMLKWISTIFNPIENGHGQKT